MTNTIRYTHNNFYLLNIPFLIVPLEVLKGLMESQDVDFHRQIYCIIKKNTREKLLQQFTQNFGLDKEKELTLVKDFFTASGWGNLQIIDMDIQSKRAIVITETSPFAEELKGKTKLPADTLLRGALAGMFSKIFEDDIDCVEIECEAKGSERCKFILKPKTTFDFTNKIVQQQLCVE